MDSYYSGLEDLDVTLISDQNMDDYSGTFKLPFNISSLVQENLEPQENLFGQSEFTFKCDENFDQIIEQLVNKHERNFGIKEINEEISSKIESGCRINLPNVVILEPGPASDSNAAIFESINMYLKDFEQDQRMMAIQDECDRLLLLYNKFMRDNVVSTGDRNTKQYTEAFWELVDELTSAFNHPDLTQHNLF
ncbi:13795_t:CDS:2 [Dentiscutata heterogama]|uniref:13795_t:CDS:1 n=1 Tax=Dentiscutata heterogama TaxID=1316150 RepID=A0ACA9KPA4_9GLOM|nr:13795_t:CDS:2 [Dentiscutata heterogama]